LALFAGVNFGLNFSYAQDLATRDGISSTARTPSLLSIAGYFTGMKETGPGWKLDFFPQPLSRLTNTACPQSSFTIRTRRISRTAPTVAVRIDEIIPLPMLIWRAIP
jgi:hypothetical protein